MTQLRSIISLKKWINRQIRKNIIPEMPINENIFNLSIFLAIANGNSKAAINKIMMISSVYHYLRTYLSVMKSYKILRIDSLKIVNSAIPMLIIIYKYRHFLVQ